MGGCFGQMKNSQFWHWRGSAGSFHGRPEELSTRRRWTALGMTTTGVLDDEALELALKDASVKGKLSLAYLDLTEITPEQATRIRAGAPNITELDLRSNNLTGLPDELGDLRALRVVKLDYNKLEHLPALLTKLPLLTNLQMGGNLLSTMAGEFAYSLGLTVAVVYVGVAARGLETGRSKGFAAALLALAGLMHLFAAFFALVATFALFIIRPSTRTLVWTGVMGATSALVAAFWVLPFFANRALLNDMGWGKERRYVAALWDRSGNFGDQTFLINSPPLQLLIVLAVIGLILSGARRVRLGMALGFVAVVFAAAFLLLPEGRLWNVRLLPFYYLSINLLAGIGVAEMGRLLVGLVRNSGDTARAFVTAGPALVATLAIWVHLGLPLHSLPYGSTDTSNGYSWTFWSTDDLHLGPYWLAHNFRGYEGTAAAAEYEQLITTMARVGEEYGCGRSLWEYQSERLGSYGTPMAPMLLPHWTDGCIGSMEGLYFEASATTPYHFLMQSELSQSPSRAQRDLPYSPLNVAQGVGHLQDMGVRYYLAFTDEAIVQAQSDLRLTEIATSGPWVIFLVNDADLVVGLDRLPVVVDGAQGGGEEWLVPTVAAWEAGDVPLIAESGPPGWPRISTDEIEASIPAVSVITPQNPTS